MTRFFTHNNSVNPLAQHKNLFYVNIQPLIPFRQAIVPQSKPQLVIINTIQTFVQYPI